MNRAQIIDYLIPIFADLTKLPADRIDAEEQIEYYGIDSTMVGAFAQMLERDLGELPRTLLYECPTIAVLADFLLKNHRAALDLFFRIKGSPAEEMIAPPQTRERPAATVSPIEPTSPVVIFDRSRAIDERALPQSDEIAIIGISGRYPQADDLDAFWANLAEGKDCIQEVPPDRWDFQTYYDAEPGKPGKTSNKWGGFLNDLDKFDPLFFNISPAEARFMDPQERVFLETVWKTIEDAGYAKAALSERRVGVFVGVMYGHYQLFGVEERQKGNLISLSSSFASIANRVSFIFNWHGPSLAIDTMCSSSLTSIHLACESLKRGECELAVAGGVNATLHPEKDIVLSQSGFSATDGRCKTFGEGGTGYVPGEGVGALLLKPLRHAEADRDHIYGVIKASAINHGGRTNGYTVPSSKSQTEVVLEALSKAKIDPATVNYIEAHGTGTVLGDPIEIIGLQQAFAEASHQQNDHGPNGKLPRQFCAIGSVKSNIGHCESAAGIAGVTKVLLQLKHQKLVPSLHATRLNPNIKFDETFFRVQRSLEDWHPPISDGRTGPRRAGVSSFGAGGANAHLIIEEYLAPEDVGVTASPAKPLLIILSAKNAERLREAVGNLARHLGSRSGPNGNTPTEFKESSLLRDAAYTLQVGRDQLEERIGFVAINTADCLAALQRWLDHGEGGYAGNAKKSSMALDQLRESASLEQTIRSLILEDDLHRLAELWVAGATIDWAGLYGELLPRRISLPTYPFARHRHWIPRPAGSQGQSAKGVVELLESTEPGGVSPIDFSIMFFSENSQVAVANKYELVFEAAKYADAHGFAGIWTPERHFHPFGGIYSSPATLLGALAAVTRQIRLRAGSVVVPLEDPLRIAEAWSVVDNLSNGRVDLACASGWNPNDFALAPDIYPNLREIWLARIPQVQRLWRGEAIERKNGKGETVNLRVYPQPIQKELPIWLTASRRVETFIDAGERGYNVLTMLQGSTLAQLSEKIAKYREARRRSSLDPATGKVTLMLHTFVHPDGEYARKLVRKPFLEYIRSSLDSHKAAFTTANQIGTDDLDKMAEFSYARYCHEASLIGDPESCFSMVKKCHEIGVDDIACLIDFGADSACVIDSLPSLNELRLLSLKRLEPVQKLNGAPATRPVAAVSLDENSAQPDLEEIPGRLLTVDWIESALKDQKPKACESLLFVYSAESRLLEAMADSLNVKSVFSIKLGEQNRRLGPADWEIDLNDKHSLESCLSQLPSSEVIYFAGALGLPLPGGELARVELSQRHGPIAFIRLIQAMDRLGWMSSPRAIRVLTSGAYALSDEDGSPYASGLSGLAGALAKEYPRVDFAHLDLALIELANQTARSQIADAIAAEPPQRSGEKIALRSGRRYRLQLRLTEALSRSASAFRKNGVYMILGGAGSVGFQLSLYLARTYQAKLLWIGRRPSDPQIALREEQIRRAGGEVLYFQGRGEDLPRMREALQLVGDRFGPLNGVIHSTLVFQDELLRKLDDKWCEEILNSKTKTAGVIAELTRDLPLDFLLFLGSAQSFFNEARRAVYAAGCSFVDAYAHFLRRKSAFPVRLINWGFWSHSFDSNVRQTIREAGLDVVQVEEGMRTIENTLASGPSQAIYLKANLAALRRMGIDPSDQFVYLPENREPVESLEALLTSSLFD